MAAGCSVPVPLVNTFEARPLAVFSASAGAAATSGGAGSLLLSAAAGAGSAGLGGGGGGAASFLLQADASRSAERDSLARVFMDSAFTSLLERKRVAADWR